MEAADAWLATDKLYHVLFCFSLTVLFSVLANRIRYPFVRRWSMSIGSSLSLLVAGGKETADQFGFFHSAGASAKDAVADFFGVLIGCFALSVSKLLLKSSRPYAVDRVLEISPV